MADKIDWTAPLEAYHPDGTVVAVELDNLCPLSDYRIKPLAEVNSWVEFNEDGTHVFGDVPWRIRNRKAPESKPSEGVTPELVERMVEVVRFVEKSITHPDNRAKARAILAEYEAATKPPVDPLVEAMNEALHTDDAWHSTDAEDFRDALAKRGLTITKADAS